MSNKVMSSIHVLLLLSVSFTTCGQDLCIAPGDFAVGYFNGVANTRFMARHSLNEIEVQNSTKYNAKTIRYVLFYNQTGSGGVDTTVLEDLAEVFIQRSEELDGVLSNRWEVFWEVLGSSSDSETFVGKLTDKIGKISDSFADLIGSIFTSFSDTLVTYTADMLSNPPTSVNHDEHRALVD